MNIVIFFCKEKIDQYAVPVMPVFKLDLSIYIVHVVHAHFFGQRENYIIIPCHILVVAAYLCFIHCTILVFHTIYYNIIHNVP